MREYSTSNANPFRTDLPLWYRHNALLVKLFTCRVGWYVLPVAVTKTRTTQRRPATLAMLTRRSEQQNTT